MKIIICEKTFAAKIIASVLGVTSREDGYFEENGGAHFLVYRAFGGDGRCGRL